MFSLCSVLTAEAKPGTATINYADTQQRIDGFGASSAWMGAISAMDADLLFSTNAGAGLSLLRTRIAPGGVVDDGEGSIAQMASARGARIWSSPWSPAANFKDNGSVNGGNYVDTPANNASCAGELASYVLTMKNTYGVSLYAVSVQNEPDVQQSYESCQWTGVQIHDFVPALYNQLAAYGVGNTKIMLPEDEFWQWNLATETWNDSNTQPLIGILAAHNYNNNYNQAPTPLFTSNLSNSNTVPVWETEHYFGSDDTITNGMQLAQEIHNFMTVGNANAYHYWWLEGSGNGSIMGNSSASPAKRLFVMGNYSRFVRPNFYRIGVTNTSGALISAYKNPASGNIVVVAVNSTANTIQETFNFTNSPAIGSMTPWITSASLSLANQAPIMVTSNSFTYSLPPSTVISFVPSVPNDSFESQAVSQGNALIGDPVSWSSSLLSGTVDAVISPGSSGSGEPWPSVPVSGMDGSNYCQIFSYAAGGGGLVYQDTGIKYQAGYSYTLTAAFGLQTNQTFDAGSSFGLYSSGLLSVSSKTITTNNLIPGAFTNISMTCTGTGSEGGNGDIIVGFYAPAAALAQSYFDFDNIHLVVTPPVAPSITTQPVSKTTNAGSSASFTAVATGTGPLSYQWYSNTNSLINGATNSSLTLTNVQISETDDVVVSNPYGSITSSIAKLTVIPNPPGTLVATPGVKSVALSFSSVASAKFYTVYRSKISGGPYSKIATTIVPKYTDLNVAAGTTYYYVVNACDGVNMSTYSPGASASPH